LVGDNLGIRARDVVLGSFTHDDGETRFQMPIDVAMENPWARVVGEEADGNVPTIDSNDVTLDRINKVSRVAIRGLDDVECVSVKMEWMSASSRDVNFNCLVARENEEMFTGNEVLRLCCAGKNLKQCGNGGRNPGDAVDFPERRVGLSNVQEDVDIRGTRASGETREEGRVKVLFQHWISDVGRSCHRWFFLGSAFIAEDGKGERVVEIGVSAWASDTTGTRGTDPVVSNGLVSSNDGRVSLGDEDIKLVDDKWIALDTVSFDDSHIMTIDREAVEWPTSNVDDTETVALALFDVDDRERSFRTTLESSSAVDEDGIWDGDDGRLEILLLQQGGLLMVVIGDGDNGAFIIDVVHVRKRILRVVDDQCTAHTITVLGSMVRVIPERAGLFVQGEGVEESRVGCNGALSDKGRAIVTVGPVLEETMPMDSRTSPHTGVGNVVMDIQVQLITLVCDNQRSG